MRKLPLDISTFSELRAANYIYIDKTKYIYHIITGGRRYFLSRPRRFGKSLLVSTLKEVLSGNKDLFDGLWIRTSDYSWHEHGIILLDFSLLNSKTVEVFQKDLCIELYRIAENYEIVIERNVDDPNALLKHLVHALFKRFGRVAILVDEYDNQILKSLHNKELAREIRDEIQHFFTVIKALDAQIQFVFITGVSSFAKAGLFSGINNVQLLTLRHDYAAICGYTDQELDHYFADYIEKWTIQKHIPYDTLRAQIKSWYNGYSFGYDVPKVYNPFSVMNALNIEDFKNFWFQSGIPTFLVDMIKNQSKVFDPEDLTASEDFLGIFDIDNLPLLSLMFQTGYLTIVGYDQSSTLYTLDYPNLELKQSFQKYLLEIFAHINAAQADQLSKKLKKAFEDENIDNVVEIIQQLFAHVPYQLHSTEEKFYHGLFIMVLVSVGIKFHAEYSTSQGRIDLVLEFSHKIYIIEIKFNQSAQVALSQIEDRKYYEKFFVQGKVIILLGLSFKKEPQRFTVDYAMKRLQP